MMSPAGKLVIKFWLPLHPLRFVSLRPLRLWNVQNVLLINSNLTDQQPSPIGEELIQLQASLYKNVFNNIGFVSIEIKKFQLG